MPILSNFFGKKRTQNHPQCLSGLSRALFPTTFLEIAVYNYLFMCVVSTPVNGIKRKLWERCITHLTLFLGRGCRAVNNLNSEFGGRGADLAITLFPQTRNFTPLCLSSPSCINGCRRNTIGGNSSMDTSPIQGSIASILSLFMVWKPEIILGLMSHLART